MNHPNIYFQNVEEPNRMQVNIHMSFTFYPMGKGFDKKVGITIHIPELWYTTRFNITSRKFFQFFAEMDAQAGQQKLYWPDWFIKRFDPHKTHKFRDAGWTPTEYQACIDAIKKGNVSGYSDKLHSGTPIRVCWFRRLYGR